MKRTLVLSGLVLAVFMTAGAANAEKYRRDGWWNYHDERWCLSQENTMATDCSYRTFEQCNYSRNGTGGSCRENPRYVDRDVRLRRVKRANR